MPPSAGSSLELAGIDLLRFRRVLGQVAFAHVRLHFLGWLFLDEQVWSQVRADIVERPHITIGMAGLLSMVPLIATSDDRSIRRLGAVSWRPGAVLWRRLHKLAYMAMTLGAVHRMMLVRGWQWEPLLYLEEVAVVLALRPRPTRPSMRMAR